MTDDTRQPQRIQFSNGNEATLVRVSPQAVIDQVLKSLHLPVPRSLLVLNGSTRDLPEAIRNRLTPLFEGLAELVAGERITVVTGGTKAGIFSLFGQALQKAGGTTAPCIGIAVAGRMHPARFEPNHSHFVIVEGKDWGEETALMYGLVADLSKNCPSIIRQLEGDKCLRKRSILPQWVPLAAQATGPIRQNRMLTTVAGRTRSMGR